MNNSMPSAAAAAQGVVPLTNRRPRVREVSSRFMSSSSSFNASNSTPEAGAGGGSDLHILPALKSPKHGGGGISTPAPAEFQARLMMQRSKTTDETIRRSYSDSPFGSNNYNKVTSPAQNKQRGPAVKLFKENNAGGGGEQQQQQQRQCQLSDDDDDVVLQQSKKSLVFTTTTAVGKSSSRPDTPIAVTSDRIIPSRFRLSSSQNFNRSQTNKLIPLPTPAAASAASKLLQSSGLSLSAQQYPPNSNLKNTRLVGDARLPSSDDLSSTIQEEEVCISRTTCPNSPVSIQNNSSSRTRSHPDMRSSMPDTRLLLAERSCNNTIINNIVSDSHLNSKFSAASPCSRSLNSSLSNSVVKMMGGGSLCLPPPHPACSAKLGPAADAARKGRKVFTHQEQVHSLRLLHNHYLQWRYANAKEEASLNAQTRDTERKLHSLGVKISDLRDDVKRKRDELGLLQRTKTLSTILETHMPYLDEWSALEEEYSTSLSGTTHALVNSLVRLPVGGNVQADIREVGEALNSAIKVMEMIGIHVQSFMPKANKMDTLISELARLVGGERVLIEECGDLLFKTYTSQVEDCSLRGHLMQLQNNNHFQLQE